MPNMSLDRALATAKSKVRAGAIEEARQIYQSVLSKFPSNTRAKRGLDALPAPVIAAAPDEQLSKLILLFENRQYEQATQFGGSLAARYPNDATVHNVLGATFGELGQNENAAACFWTAVQLDPSDPEAHYNLGAILPGLSRPGEALPCLVKAIELAPEETDYWRSLADLLQTISFKAYDESFETLFLRLLKQPNVCEPAHLVRPVVRLLMCHEAVKKSASQAERSGSNSLTLKALKGLSEIPLLNAILRLCVIPNPDLERVLRTARASVLEHRQPQRLEAVAPDFLVSLALNCHINEFVWVETKEETEKILKLEQDLDQGERTLPALACLASYRSLHNYAWKAEVGQVSGCEAIHKAHITATEIEAEIRTSIPKLTQIENAVSQAVQNQYEENPYPRWVTSIGNERALGISEYLGTIGISSTPATQDSNAAPEVLVAGCGTGQHAIGAARRYANSHVLAIDLSRSSLAYAIRKTNELGIANIDYQHADILELSMLDRQFDVIECVGVLHHMDQPMDGWKTLTARLKPGGVMKIGLYSEMARREIVAARDAIAKLGYDAEKSDIRRFRQALMSGELRHHDDLSRLAQLSDFYSTSECRDMLFHVQEHRYSLPEIQDCLRTLNLEFLGFHLPDSLTKGPKAQGLPSQNSLECLDEWNAYERENPDTFIRMYQFWARKA